MLFWVGGAGSSPASCAFAAPSDLSDEYAAGSTTETVVGVGQALAGSGEGASVHGFVVGCFASLC